MNKEFEIIFSKLDEKTIALFLEIDALIHESVTEKINEKLWQNAPLYYVGGDENFKPFSNCVHNRSLHILPFKGHINIYAPEALSKYYDKLKGYKITPKAGMLQIFCNQEIPKETLKAIFKESLIG